jgi:hypothetical protein
MKHQEIEQLKTVAKVDQGSSRRPMSRTERLERWAEVLERNPHWLLSTLPQTEYKPARERAAMRANDSPISVAFADPVLRAAGFEDDSYGEAKRFFELSDHQLHKIVCYCHFGETVSAATVARHLRVMATARPPGILARLRGMFTI